MKYLHFLLTLLLAIPQALSASSIGQFFLDKEIYITGERLHISIQLPDTVSRVAYIEISDAHHTCAQGMAALSSGSGWADIALPSSMHSGHYLVSVYTRAMRNQDASVFPHRAISVVNPLRVSRADEVTFYPIDSLMVASSASPGSASFASIQQLDSSLLLTIEPSLLTTVTLYSNDLQDPELVSLQASAQPSFNQPQSGNFTVEAEGHQVQARPSRPTDIVTQTRLVMVGPRSSLFDGQWQSDGSYLYYTTGIYGHRPALLQSLDAEGHLIPMEFISPFAGINARSLPKLRLYCSEQELRQRAQSAQQQQEITNWLSGDSLSFSSLLLSSQPDFSYDLDEYTKFSSVREILIEFVRGVKRQKVGGINQLFTYVPGTFQYSDWAALVLIDGVPVTDIDDILEYDARLLRYVQIYADRYTFGGALFGGIISFTSRKGLLSNYKLDNASRLVSYSFPQDHPTVIQPPSPQYGTLFWCPSVESLDPSPETEARLSVPLPSAQGSYRLLLQRLHHDGTTQVQTYDFDLK